MSKRLFLATILVLLGSVGVTYVDRLAGRLHHLEQDERIPPARFERLAHELAEVQAALAGSRRQLERYEEDRGIAARLGQRLDLICCDIRETRTELEKHANVIAQQSSELQSIENEQDRYLGEKLEDHDQRLEERWKVVERTIEATARLAEDSQASVRELVHDLEAKPVPNREEMWKELMGPIVQLADESTVGSGVLLEAGQDENQTYLLTAWHVVRDILDDPSQLDQLVPVHVYQREGGYEARTATLLEHDANLDVALLAMETNGKRPYGARLASRERLCAVNTFDPIYAVGCPLGNDPIPTYGEVADIHHKVDGDRYWMISAPTYIGNSGGGIFDAERHELLGIFSKIYTHGNLRPTVVPHMGLVTPLLEIYDWLEKVGYGVLLESQGEQHG